MIHNDLVHVVVSVCCFSLYCCCVSISCAALELDWIVLNLCVCVLHGVELSSRVLFFFAWGSRAFHKTDPNIAHFYGACLVSCKRWWCSA